MLCLNVFVRLGKYTIDGIVTRFPAAKPAHLVEAVSDAEDSACASASINVEALPADVCSLPVILESTSIQLSRPTNMREHVCRQCLLSTRTINILTGRKHSSRLGCPFSATVILELRSLSAAIRSYCEATFPSYIARNKYK